jgi:hypothetical protein
LPSERGNSGPAIATPPSHSSSIKTACVPHIHERRDFVYQTPSREPRSNMAATRTYMSPSVADLTPQARRLRLRYSTSFSSSKIGVEPDNKPSLAGPVLTPVPAHAQAIAVPTTNTGIGPASAANNANLRARHLSWSRRAAAVALDIGRKIRARKTSSSSSSGLGGSGAGAYGRYEPGRGGVMYREQ